MSIIKLAVYGAIGYLIYQTFFAEGAGMQMASRGQSGGGSRGGGGSMGMGGSQDHSIGGTRMTGGGTGRTEQTEDASGAAVSHRVGRGVR